MLILSGCLHDKRMQRPVQWLLKKMRWSVGCLMDEINEDAPWALDPGYDMFLRVPNQRRDRHALLMESLGLETASAPSFSGCKVPTGSRSAAEIEVIGNDLRACLLHCAHAMHVRLAVGAARFGEIDTMCGLIMVGYTETDNTTMKVVWLCPNDVLRLKYSTIHAIIYVSGCLSSNGFVVVSSN